MARRKNVKTQLDMLRVTGTTAPCVLSIRAAVDAWREAGYPGSSETTRMLLRHWFESDHLDTNGRRFAYMYFQREAMETLVYLTEIEKVANTNRLLDRFAVSTELRVPEFDAFPRYALKMATGTGKTKVVSLVVAWQYLNAVVEGRSDFATTFVVIAPNLIVYERLRTDFEGGRIFRVDPVIPRELGIYWDLASYMVGEEDRVASAGALYLTNVQRLYTRPKPEGTEPSEMTGVLGPDPGLVPVGDSLSDYLGRRQGPVVVVNDEAHHTHDESNEWNSAIRRIQTDADRGISMQLDMSATPRTGRGQLFPWVVFDYPLKQAIIDNVVKRPLKGIATGIPEPRSKIASVQYQAYLVAGVERWREYVELLTKTGKRPILFVMMNSTEDANDVGDWLQRKFPSEFGGERLLVIHTDRTGEVRKDDLPIARRLARDVDKESSSVSCIVSVLMLREGWDVQNVTVIVGLRPYSAKANILPEQTVGRGLRLMFRGSNSGYVERVDVIGNRNFIHFVEALERDEDLDLETFVVGKDKLAFTTILPDPAKLTADIEVPVLSPILVRKKSLDEEIKSINVNELDAPVLPVKEGVEDASVFRYEGYDLITLRKLVERDYSIPSPQTPEEVLGYYAKRIAQELKLPAHFAVLAPKVEEFLAQKAFGVKVNLTEPAILLAISSNVAHYVTVRVFVNALRGLAVREQTAILTAAPRRLSETRPFPWSRLVATSKKTVFNLVACENKLERDFAVFLDKAVDVAAFSKLPEAFDFVIEYVDQVGSLHFYEPDFIVMLDGGATYIVETKGREDLLVAAKDRAASLWAENASRLTGQAWRYLKVLEDWFRKLQPESFYELVLVGDSAPTLEASLFSKSDPGV
jgi:type III restriction enzyme